MRFRNMKKIVALTLAVATVSATAVTMQSAIANPLYAATSTTSFTDLPSSHWAYKYVMEAAEKGWVSGTGNGRYNPSGKVTLAEFLTMVVKAFYPGEEANHPSGAWYEPYYWVADENDLMFNTGHTIRDVNKTLNRYEMASIAAMTLKYKGGETMTSEEREAVKSKIPDWNKVPSQYWLDIPLVVSRGVMSGIDSNGTFAGDRSMDRAQAAVVLCKMAEVFDAKGTLHNPLDSYDALHCFASCG